MARNHIWARNVGGCQQAVHISGELMCVLAADALPAPALTRPIEGAHSCAGSDVALHPRPARRSLSKAVEQHHGGRPCPLTTQVEAMAGHQIGATTGWPAGCWWWPPEPSLSRRPPRPASAQPTPDTGERVVTSYGGIGGTLGTSRRRGRRAGSARPSRAGRSAWVLGRRMRSAAPAMPKQIAEVRAQRCGWSV